MTEPASAMDLTSPLDDGEFDRLAALLRDVGGDATMNLETLDGFFCALVVGPEVVMPSEYLPVVLGTAEPTFDTENQARDLMTLLVRHWNAIASGIEDDGSRVHVPLLLEDDSGIARGNDWARGFLRGVDMRRDAWRPFVDDEEHGGPMIPIFALAYEHDPDPSMRPYKEPMTPEQRDALILHAAAGLMQTRRYFRRFGTARLRRSDPVRRASAKVGRNDPCRCGSGRKFKHCCGRESLH